MVRTRCSEVVGSTRSCRAGGGERDRGVSQRDYGRGLGRRGPSVAAFSRGSNVIACGARGGRLTLPAAAERPALAVAARASPR